jgi:hypothetical protein
MKTRDLAATLIGFAGLAEAGRADELRKLANAFGRGKDETVAARLKKLSPASEHPATLRATLVTIEGALRAAGATKQALDIGAVLQTFQGPSGATVDEFIAQLSVPRPAVPRKKRAAAPLPDPDYTLARALADELTRTLLETTAFDKVIERLSDARQVNGPTLACVANRFLGNSKTYKGRKTAIDDIVRRQKADAREHARGRALSRVGV